MGEQGATGRQTAPPTSRHHVIYTQSTPNCVTLGSGNTLLRAQCEFTGALAAGAPASRSGKEEEEDERVFECSRPSWSQAERLWSGTGSWL